MVDLGTGTGRLALGAALLGAARTTGIDIDPTAISVALENSKVAGLDVDWVVGDLEVIRGRFDTVVMNPPFGTKTKHVDKIFLKKALGLASIVYSFHKSATREHVLAYLGRSGAKVSAIHEYTLGIPRMFQHHKKRKHVVRVDCYRIESRTTA